MYVFIWMWKWTWVNWNWIHTALKIQLRTKKKQKRSGHNMRMNSTLHVSMCFSTYTQPLQFIVANSIFVLLLDQLLAMCDLVHMNRFRFEHFYNNNKKTKTKQLNSCNELLFVFSAVYVHIFYFHGCVCFRPHFWFCTKREHHLILPPNRMKFCQTMLNNVNSLFDNQHFNIKQTHLPIIIC